MDTKYDFQIEAYGWTLLQYTHKVTFDLYNAIYLLHADAVRRVNTMFYCIGCSAFLFHLLSIPSRRMHNLSNKSTSIHRRSIFVSNIFFNYGTWDWRINATKTMADTGTWTINIRKLHFTVQIIFQSDRILKKKHALNPIRSSSKSQFKIKWTDKELSMIE